MSRQGRGEYILFVLLIVLVWLLITACGYENTYSPQGLRHDLDKLETVVSALTTPSPTHTMKPQAPTNTPQAPTKVPPTPIRGGIAGQLPVPAGTSVVWGGCASDGSCFPFNFYWGPTHEAVMQNAQQGHYQVQHEVCHAHQHWAINGGAALIPSDYDLESWYATAEGQSFMTAVPGQPWPWSHSAVNGLEDFAWTCAYWYEDPAGLLSRSLERYGWARENLP